MLITKKKILKYLLIALIGSLTATLLLKRQNNKTPRDWEDIVNSGEINIVTTYNSLDYFVDKDTIQGFHYELLKALFQNKNLSLNIKPSANLSQQIDNLKAGEFDILATNLITTTDLKNEIALTTPVLKNNLVLVQRKDSVALADSLFISNHLNLAKKTIYTIKGSPAILRINNLSNEIADTIFIKELERYGEEQLIALVAHGDIDYAVCDKNIAIRAKDSLPQIDISLAIGFTQFYSWGVNLEATQLLDSLNSWLHEFRASQEYFTIYTKYYKQ